MLRVPGSLLGPALGELQLDWNRSVGSRPLQPQPTSGLSEGSGLFWGAVSLSLSPPFATEANSPLSTFSSFLFQRTLGSLNADGYTPDPVGEHLQSPLLLTGNRTGMSQEPGGSLEPCYKAPFLQKHPGAPQTLWGPAPTPGSQEIKPYPIPCLTQEMKPCPIPIFH